MDEIIKILNDEGYETISGAGNIFDAIDRVANENTKQLCSGFGVFPGGEKCSGCSDCKQKR